MFLFLAKFQPQNVLNLFLLKYFNTVLREYKVEFDDGTSDYIEPSDIDNVEVMILDV